MVFYLAAFLLGIIILLISAEVFVKLASKVSSVFRISPLIIGTTIVAVGTSFPELIVSLVASAKKDYGLAIGNIIGSNIINIFFVLAIGIILGNINIGTSKTQRSALLLALATLTYIFLSLANIPGQIAGLLLIVLAIIFSLLEVDWGIAGRNREDKAYMKHHSNTSFGLHNILLTSFCFLGILIGGMVSVYGVEKLSLLTGYSTGILGLSLAAVATSLPELLTTVFSRKKDQGKIAIGSILGSNVYNLLLIGGLVNLFSPEKVMAGRHWLALLFATACLVAIVFGYRGKAIPKKVGLLLLVFFLAYIYTLK